MAASQTMEPPVYEYQALPSEGHIRRLILAPGTGDDLLHGDLETVLLAEASTLTPFEAISYAWGSNEKNRCIMIAGRAIPITTNLEEVLRQARLPDKRRALWADSVCINQADHREKGQQVTVMGEIYQRSSCTLICFGLKQEQHSDAQDAAALTADVNRMMQDIFDDPGFSWDWDAFPYINRDSPLAMDGRWESWMRLITQPWFSRGWVVQEAALGPNACVLWAGVEIDWMSLLRANYWWANRAMHLWPISHCWEIPESHGLMFTVRQFDVAKTLRPESMRAGVGDLPLLSILNHSRVLGLKDPRDRIYAFMAVPTSDGAMPALEPDYREQMSHLDVYRDFAIKFLENTSNLELLSFVEYDDDDDTGHALLNDAQLSSWVPRWDRGAYKRSEFDEIYRRIKSDLQDIRFLSGGSALQVRAVVFDSVVWVSEKVRDIPEHATDASGTATTQVVKLWRAAVQQSIKYPGPHSSRLALVFLVALCRGQLIGELHEWKRSREAFVQLLESDSPERSLDTYAGHEGAGRISHFISRRWHHCRLVLLGRGYYASASTVTRAGDVCAVVFGTRSPFILRKVSGKSNHYRVVGAAYVQSKVSNDDGVPRWLGGDKLWEDWTDWDLPTKNIILC